MMLGTWSMQQASGQQTMMKKEKETQMANKQSRFCHLTSYNYSVEQQMHAFCHSLNHYTVWLNGKSSCHLS